jgi:hypothetical protein
MTKEYRLDQKNVDNEEKIMRKVMDCFEEWMQEKESYMKHLPN